MYVIQYNIDDIKTCLTSLVTFEFNSPLKKLKIILANQNKFLNKENTIENVDINVLMLPLMTFVFI